MARHLCLALGLCTLIISGAQARGLSKSPLTGSLAYGQVASQDLIIEADGILRKARELMDKEEYKLAEIQINQLLGSKFEDVLFPKIAVGLYLDMSLIYQKLGKLRLGLDYARKASDISLTLKGDPYLSWPSLKYGIQYLDYWSDPQVLLEIVERIDKLLLAKQQMRDKEYLGAVGDRLVFAYLQLSQHLASKGFRPSEDDSVKILSYLDRSLEIMNRYDLDNPRFERELLWFKVYATTRNNVPLKKQVAMQVLPIQRDLYELDRTLYGPKDEKTLSSLSTLALIASAAEAFDDSIEYRKLHYGLIQEIHGRYSPEALNSLEGLGNIYFHAGRGGLSTSTKIKLIQDSREAYGSSSLEYKNILIKIKKLSRFSGAQQSFIDQEIKRLDSLSGVGVGSEQSSDVSESGLVELLLRLDADKWTIKYYMDCGRLLVKAAKLQADNIFDGRSDLIALSKKYVEAGKILHGENSFDHVASLSMAAMVVSRYDQSIAIELYDQLLELSEKVFFANPGHLASVYLSAMFFGQRLGVDEASQYLAQKYLEARFSYYKRVLPFMNSEDRLSEMEADAFPFDSIYTSAVKGRLSGDVAAFAVINRHGLLGELEKQHSRLDVYDQESQDFYLRLSSLNSELSRAGLTREARANLTRQRLELELILSERYGFSPEIIRLSEIKKNIPDNAVLLQTRLIENISLKEGSQLG